MTRLSKLKKDLAKRVKVEEHYSVEFLDLAYLTFPDLRAVSAEELKKHLRNITREVLTFIARKGLYREVVEWLKQRKNVI